MPKRILIVRRDNIGDLLCTTPLIRSLRQKYPGARIDALVNSYNAPVLAGNRDLDNVYAYTKAKHRHAGETVLGVYFRRLKLIQMLRRTHYDWVFLAGDGNLARQIQLVRWIKPRQIVGFAAASTVVHDLDWAIDGPHNGHEVERTHALLSPLSITSEPPAMVLAAEPEERKRLELEMASAWGSATPEPIFALHISARKEKQRWPIENFAALAHRLNKKSGARFLLFWSPGDAKNPFHPGDDDKAAELLEAMAGLPVLPLKTARLSELIAGLSLCDLAILSDGGAMHVAAALGKPIVCFFGNSEAKRWYPWGVPHVLLQSPSRDVSDISLECALEAVERLPWRNPSSI